VAGLRRLESLSVYRVSVLQRMRASSRAQHVVSTIICRCARSSGANGDFGGKQGELLAGQALQPAHEPYRHIGTPPAQQWCCRRRAGFPRLMVSLGTENAGAASLSSVGAGNQVLALTLGVWRRETAGEHHKPAEVFDRLNRRDQRRARRVRRNPAVGLVR
jgi:hypothetical protein